MIVDIKVDSGTEGYLKFARERLVILDRLRAELNLPVIRRHYMPKSGVLIRLESSEFGNRIRISGGVPPGLFVLYMKVAKRTEPFTTFDYETTPEVMPLDEKEIIPFVLNNVSYEVAGIVNYRKNKKTKSYIRDSGPPIVHGFSDERVVTKATGSDSSSVDSMLFDHAYVEDDVSKSIKLRIPTTASNPTVRVAATGVALTSSGTVSDRILDVSPDGRKAVGLLVDRRTDYAIDVAASPQVVKSETELGVPGGGPGYGTDVFHEVYDYDFPGSVVNDYTIEGHPLYPVAIGYSAAGVEQQISVRHDYFQTGHRNATVYSTCVLTVDGGTGLGEYVAAGADSASANSTFTIIMPNGFERVLIDRQFSVFGSGGGSRPLGGTLGFECEFNGPWTGSGSGGGTNLVSGVLSILYSDASLPALVYKYVSKTYARVISVVVDPINGIYLSDANAGGVGILTQDTYVRLILGSTETEIFHSTEILDDDGMGQATAGIPVTPGAGPGAYAAIWTGFTSASVDDTISTVIENNAYGFIAAHSQNETLAFAGHGPEDPKFWVAQYKHSVGDTYHIGGSGPAEETLIERLIEKIAPTPEAEAALNADQLALLNALRTRQLSDYDVTLADTNIGLI